MVYSYGKRRTGKWITLAEGGTALEVGELKPRTSDTFEVSYSIPKKAPKDYEKWQATFNLLGVSNFNQGLIEILAFQKGVDRSQFEILWWQYNNESDPANLTIQVKYTPKQIGILPVAGEDWLTLFRSGALITYLKDIFQATNASFEGLKYLLEQLNVALKYGLYLVLAGGGIYLLAKFLPKLLKKGEK